VETSEQMQHVFEVYYEDRKRKQSEMAQDGAEFTNMGLQAYRL
jgi:hypothetical protein